MTSDRPLVSVLTPSFNQGRFLQDCITSVANQTYRPIEHIVVDGGSTDETLDILSRAPEHVRWVSEPDRGQSHALNKALAMSRGEIIGWVNSDDAYFVRDAVGTGVEAFRRSPDLGVVFGDVMMIDEVNCVIGHHCSTLPDWSSLALFSSPISQPAAFIRRESLGADRVFLREELEVTLDLELWLRLHRAGVKFRHIPSPMAVDRDHESRKVRNLQAKAHLEDSILASEYSLTFRHSFFDRVRSWRRRLAGLREFWGVHDRNDLAIQISMPPLFPLLLNQLLLPHSMQRTLSHRKQVLAK